MTTAIFKRSNFAIAIAKQDHWLVEERPPDRGIPNLIQRRRDVPAISEVQDFTPLVFVDPDDTVAREH